MPKHEAMDSETVADLLDVSVRQVRTYVSQFGMPCKQDGRTRTFVWPEVLNWYVGYKSALEYGDRLAVQQAGTDAAEEDEQDAADVQEEPGRPEDIRAATLRKTRAEANLKELKLSQERREVLNIADAKTVMDRMFLNLRTQLMNLPTRLSSQLAGVKEPSQQEAAMKQEVERMLHELSTGQFLQKLPGSPTAQGDEEEGDESVESISAAADPGSPRSNLDALRDFAEENGLQISAAGDHATAQSDLEVLRDYAELLEKYDDL